MPLRFPGQLYEAETESWGNTYSWRLDVIRPGLHENRFRTYDPFTGSYLQVDPKVDDTWEAYRYAGQDPVMLIDPTGEQQQDPEILFERQKNCRRIRAEASVLKSNWWAAGCYPWGPARGSHYCSRIDSQYRGLQAEWATAGCTSLFHTSWPRLVDPDEQQEECLGLDAALEPKQPTDAFAGLGVELIEWEIAETESDTRSRKNVEALESMSFRRR